MSDSVLSTQSQRKRKHTESSITASSADVGHYSATCLDYMQRCVLTGCSLQGRSTGPISKLQDSSIHGEYDQLTLKISKTKVSVSPQNWYLTWHPKVLVTFTGVPLRTFQLLHSGPLGSSARSQNCFRSTDAGERLLYQGQWESLVILHIRTKRCVPLVSSASIILIQPDA